MSSIILAIKEKYVKDIFDGTKTFELRRRVPKNNIKTIFIYETSPTSRIIGKLSIEKIHKLEIKHLWKLTKGKNSLTEQELLTYFHNLDYGYAFEISKKERFTTSKKIEKYNLKHPPQNFVYVK